MKVVCYRCGVVRGPSGSWGTAAAPPPGPADRPSHGLCDRCFEVELAAVTARPPVGLDEGASAQPLR